ncbi:MAG: nicotinate (nicotinamide) nucleotide adenylyltransferase [Clostridia bacterium]|nr:nicotinate (nicotinamide) nucleotide adenylyltransferase [Clostridia bacterium]
MERTAIFGGSFNPVHNEHIAIAKMAIEQLKLDRLIVMPTYIAPHKDASSTSAEHRFNMLKLAFEKVEKVEVSDYEIKKGGTSYTYLTVEHFKNTLNGELFFLVGADMLKDFKTWRYPERILSACTLCAFDRGGETTDYQLERQNFINNYGKDFILLKGGGQKQSSTKIRVYNELGLDITLQTPKKVCDYIKENGLYLGDKYSEFIKKSLPQKRLVHTANVVISALAKYKELGLDKRKVRISAMLHDCAKYIDPKTVEGFSVPSDMPAPVVHAFLGAFIAKNYLGITDEDIINAIRYHTSGRAKMSALEKLIFTADMIEDGRVYEGVEQLRKLFYLTDFDECFTTCLKEEMQHLLNKKQPIYFETLNAYEYFVKRKETKDE